MRSSHSRLLRLRFLLHPFTSSREPLAVAITGAITVISGTIVGCASDGEDASASNGAITSNDGKIVGFEFTGEVKANKSDQAREAIVAQLSYIQGILTTNEHGNGHVGQVELSDVHEQVDGQTKTIQYK